MPDATESSGSVARRTEAALANVNPKPFSHQGFAALERTITWFTSELVEESVKISKRQRSDTVAQSHVETAANYLVADASRKFFRHLGTLGGIFLGTGLSNLLSIVTTKALTVGSVILTVILGVVGAFLIALHIAKD